MTNIISLKKSKVCDKTAVIYNFSGHVIPKNGYDELTERGHTKFIVFNRSVHIDVDRSIPDQIEKELDSLFTKPNSTGQLPQSLIGDRYYVSSGHAASNLLIFTALTSLFGSAPILLVIGNDDRRWNGYELKSVIPVKPWTGNWRSQMRSRYTINEIEVIDNQENSESTLIKEYDIGTKHLVTRKRAGASVLS